MTSKCVWQNFIKIKKHTDRNTSGPPSSTVWEAMLFHSFDDYYYEMCKNIVYKVYIHQMYPLLIVNLNKTERVVLLKIYSNIKLWLHMFATRWRLIAIYCLDSWTFCWIYLYCVLSTKPLSNTHDIYLIILYCMFHIQLCSLEYTYSFIVL